MKKGPIIILISIAFNVQLIAQQSFRDSVDILNYSIYIDLSKTQTRQITGKCELKLKPIYNASKIRLDFEGLQTDSVISAGKKMKFSFNANLLTIDMERTLKAIDSITFTVFYHGTPKEDRRWGGFFMGKDYAFNYGVGMDANPPNYGRVWYPCIDNFTDRAYYEYFIQTKADQMAACPGLLESVEKLPDGTKLFHWKLHQSIPTYLSSVAVGNYAVYKDTVQGLERIIPIEVYVEKKNESKTAITFANVKKYLHAFEYRFGPYQWDKIGYVSTNFMSGAMEHATNIAYSSYCDGTTSCESTLVHELSHHWFGDLVTCASEKDMWLNEGWASFCEAVYYEYVGGTSAYKDYVRDNHRKVLIYAQNNPGAFGALYGMPHEDTYGSVVYDKGADVAHTLRGQMGDSVFFAVLIKYFKDYAYKNITVDGFKQYLSEKSNMNLDDFFDFWVYSPGFPHFAINNLKIKQVKNQYQINFTIDQKTIGTDKILKCSNVEIGILDKDLKVNIYNLKQNGNSTPVKLLIDFEPMLVLFDPNEKISDATVDEYTIIEKPGNYQFEKEKFSVDVQSIVSPLFFQVVYNWISPFKDKPFKEISKINDKYWDVNFHSNGKSNLVSRFSFNLSPIFGKPSGIDSNLKLLYRENPENKWQYTNSKLEINGREAFFTVANTFPGQYVVVSIE